MADHDEYRAILRHVPHLEATITYDTTTITITLDRPDTPDSPASSNSSPRNSEALRRSRTVLMLAAGTNLGGRREH